MMTYTGVIERETTITVDGYSSAKTMKGAIADFGRYIKKHFSEGEGENLIEYKEECLLSANNSYGGYFLEVEEVPCASNWNEEKEEMEYKDGYYFCLVCRFVK